MKIRHLLFLIVIISACQSKKTETTETVPVDSTIVNNAVQADKPASPVLSFEEMTGFALDNKVTYKDSVNYLLLTSQEDFNGKFKPGKEALQPDFLINYVIAVVCAPTVNMTTIYMEKAEFEGSTINVYLQINRGEPQKSLSKPASVFSIEKRDGVTAIQFFVNGKKKEALMVGGL